MFINSYEYNFFGLIEMKYFLFFRRSICGDCRNYFNDTLAVEVRKYFTFFLNIKDF